jgi:hypothetical protein
MALTKRQTSYPPEPANSASMVEDIPGDLLQIRSGIAVRSFSSSSFLKDIYIGESVNCRNTSPNLHGASQLQLGYAYNDLQRFPVTILTHSLLPLYSTLV